MSSENRLIGLFIGLVFVVLLVWAAHTVGRSDGRFEQRVQCWSDLDNQADHLGNTYREIYDAR